jgi:hypothetical protein
VIENLRYPFLTHVQFLKNKLHWKHKAKNNVMLRVGTMCAAFSDASLRSFLHVWCNLVKDSYVTEMFSRREILVICSAQGNREVYHQTHSGNLNKNEMPGSVRQ